MNQKEIQTKRSEQTLDDARNTNDLTDLPVTAEQEKQVVAGQRPWTLHKAVDNPDLIP